MARTLTFEVAGCAYPAAPVKVDRARLYGWTETVAVDADGNTCELALVDGAGSAIIPRGGTGMALLDGSGGWVERSSLTTVTADGAPAPVHPSSFDAPVVLTEPVSVDELLDTQISAVYQLDADPALIAAIGEQVFSFDYYFRAGSSGSRAFVLVSAGAAFLLTGQVATFEFTGLDAAVEPVVEEADDDDDDLDFEMI